MLEIMTLTRDLDATVVEGSILLCDGLVCSRGADRVILIVQASAELAATYAALILADDGIEITVRKSLALHTVPKAYSYTSKTRSVSTVRQDRRPYLGC